MNTEQTSTPNTSSAVPAEKATPSLDAIIAEKMTVMREQTLRNQMKAANEGVETGGTTTAVAEQSVEPSEVSENDTTSIGSGVDETEEQVVEAAQGDEDAPEEQVSTEGASPADIIDFLEFANENPDAKFKFMRNGKEVIIDAKKAAAILGQGGAIHEEARELKVQKAEFEEYLKDTKAKQEGLMLAMEFTVAPQIQNAYNEILKTQQYQQTFQQQLQQAMARNDVAQATKIQANMATNEQWIKQQTQVINQLKPNVEQFYNIRKEQVAQALVESRKAFEDKELRNEYVYNELREKLGKSWKQAKDEIVPGIPNIDLVASDEYLMGLVRDGLKFRERPQSKSAGGSIAALTSKRTGISNAKTQEQQNIANLQELAKKGDKKAQDNLLVAKLNAMRGRR